MAGDEPRGRRADTVLFNTGDRGLLDALLTCETELVVGAEEKEITIFRMNHGSVTALDPAKLAEEPLLSQAQEF